MLVLTLSGITFLKKSIFLLIKITLYFLFGISVIYFNDGSKIVFMFILRFNAFCKTSLKCLFVLIFSITDSMSGLFIPLNLSSTFLNSTSYISEIYFNSLFSFILSSTCLINFRISIPVG